MMMVAIVIEIMKVMIVIEIMTMITSDRDNDDDYYIDSPDLAHSTINLSPLFSLWIIC